MIFYLDKMQPKGSIGVECGEALLKHGYKLKFFNTINFSKSMRYNPMAYIHSEKDVLKLVTALMTNTKGEGQGGDPFWDKAERLLLVSLIAYLHYEAPVEEQNFATLLEMLNTMQVSEDDDVVSCVSDSHGQQSVSGAMFGQCDSFAHLRFSFYNPNAKSTLDSQMRKIIQKESKPA